MTNRICGRRWLHEQATRNIHAFPQSFNSVIQKGISAGSVVIVTVDLRNYYVTENP